VSELIVRVDRADISRLVTDEVKAQVNEVADFLTALTAAGLRGMDDRKYRTATLIALRELDKVFPADGPKG
jgi:hypothetical protein